jgi:hypothetical protein
MKSMTMRLKAMGSDEKHNDDPVCELKVPTYTSFKPTPDGAAEI